jgi:hypothetical protein
MQENPRELIGVPKSAFAEALGPAYECDDDLIQGCRGAGAWFYSFYAPLGPGAVGGGPELSLGFDRNDRCNQAEWVVSE